MVAAGALLSNPEAVAASAENMDLGFVTRCFERVIELDHRVEDQPVVLSPRQKNGGKLGRDGRHYTERTAIDWRSEVGTGCGVLLEQGSAGDHGSG